MATPAQFCKLVRESFPGAGLVYTRGGCWTYHLILKGAFPSAAPVWNGEHVWSLIDGDAYDVNGRRAAGAAGLTPMSEADKRGAAAWRGRNLSGLDALIAVRVGVPVEVIDAP